MADITVTAASVMEYNAVTGFNLIRSYQTSAAVTAGQAVYMDSAGKVGVADADSATLAARNFVGIALETKASGVNVRVLEEGWVYGFTLSGAYGDPVYLSATAGALNTVADANGGTLVGWVDRRNDVDKTKVLRVMRPGIAGGNGLARKVFTTAVNGTTLHAAANGILNLFTNPEAGNILITRATLAVTTVATGVATVDIGTNTTTLTTSDNLIDGADVNTATGVFDNTVSGGTNGKGGQVLATGKFVTIDEKTGDTTGMVATFVLEYFVL